MLGDSVIGDSDGIDEEFVGRAEGAALFIAIGKSVRVAEGVADFGIDEELVGRAEGAALFIAIGKSVRVAEGVADFDT